MEEKERNYRNKRGQQDGANGTAVQILNNFLKHKCHRSDGGIKGSGQSGGGSAGREGADAEVGEPELLTDDRGQSSGQLDRGAFPPEA